MTAVGKLSFSSAMSKCLELLFVMFLQQKITLQICWKKVIVLARLYIFYCLLPQSREEQTANGVQGEQERNWELYWSKVRQQRKISKNSP